MMLVSPHLRKLLHLVQFLRVWLPVELSLLLLLLSNFILIDKLVHKAEAQESLRKVPDDSAIIVASFPVSGTMPLLWFFVITTTPITWNF